MNRGDELAPREAVLNEATLPETLINYVENAHLLRIELMFIT